MGKINLEQLDEMQYDVLKEIGNIGAGNATTALSQMLDIRMDMSVPNVALVPFQNIAGVIGSEEQVVVGILLGLEGEIDGMMMFLFDMKSAHRLVNILMQTSDLDSNATGNDLIFSEMEGSALSEIGNIVAGSYLTALATLTDMKIIATIPSIKIDMIGSLLSIPATEFSKYGDKMLLIQSQFGESELITGYFLLIPEFESYDKILSSLGM